ncbi:transposase [Streptomyces sp. NPDC101237]|uniref:transposase n=1 Tax=Streptomyces sp. NPDC101237 TaxID=3366139 RepID=UPI00382FB3F0
MDVSAPLRLVLGLEEHFPAACVRRETSSSAPHFALLLALSLPLSWHRPSIAGPPPSRQDHHPPPKINTTLIFVRQLLVVLPRRWKVERTISWCMNARRNARDHERLPQHPPKRTRTEHSSPR